MKEAYEFLKEAKTFYLATVEGDQPRVRPFGALDVFEDKLYIQMGKVKKVSKQLHANPKVEIAAFNGEAWIRIEAVLVEDERIEAKEHMLESNPGLKNMYSATDGNTEVWYLKDATATISSFGGAPKAIKF
ncbi:MAG: pyridoxamine 5'-phosphate oxidase family protein [Clostridiales bacterium]|jgi:uncharacterized pyridoxamine 5'-phosphate oxidase family protein|nr:pyridoxamine 5'-phosphate oxidase family protein [Clostridiales bacterium]